MERVEFMVEPPDTYPGLPFNEYLNSKIDNKLLLIYQNGVFFSHICIMCVHAFIVRFPRLNVHDAYESGPYYSIY